MAPLVNSCCCGCSLEQGTTGACIFGMVSCGYLLISGIIFLLSGSLGLMLEGMMLVVLAVMFLIACILVLSAMRKDYETDLESCARLRRVCLIWVVFAAILVLLSLAYMIRTFPLLKHSIPLFIVSVLFSIFYQALMIYLAIVVWSFRKSISAYRPNFSPVANAQMDSVPFMVNQKVILIHPQQGVIQPQSPGTIWA